MTDQWKLREALQLEVERLRRRRVSILAATGIVGISASIVLSAGGANALSTATAVSTCLLMVIADRRFRATEGDSLDRAAALSVWLGQRHLIDSEGRLTDQGRSQVPEEQLDDGEASGSESPESVALGAYRSSAAFAAEGASWVGPMAEALDAVDSGELFASLKREASDARRRPAIWWLVVGPLAVVGLVLILLGVAGSLVRAIE